MATKKLTVDDLVSMDEKTFWKHYTAASLAYSVVSAARVERIEVAKQAAIEQAEAERIARMEAAQASAQQGAS